MQNNENENILTLVEKNWIRSKKSLLIDGSFIVLSFILTFISVISPYISAENSNDPSAFSALGFVFILTVPLSSVLVLGSISKFLINFMLYRYESMCLDGLRMQPDIKFTLKEYNRSRYLRLFRYRFIISLLMFGAIFLLPNILFLLLGVDISDLMIFVSVGFILPGIFHLFGCFSSYKRYKSV